MARSFLGNLARLGGATLLGLPARSTWTAGHRIYCATEGAPLPDVFAEFHTAFFALVRHIDESSSVTCEDDHLVVEKTLADRRMAA